MLYYIIKNHIRLLKNHIQHYKIYIHYKVLFSFARKKKGLQDSSKGYVHWISSFD